MEAVKRGEKMDKDNGIIRAIGKIEEHNSMQDNKLNEILKELKDINETLANAQKESIHNQYAIEKLHKRVDDLTEKIKEIKRENEIFAKKLEGNITWPGVVAVIMKSGGFLGGLGIIWAILNKIFTK